MNETDISAVFADFEKKYSLDSIFQMSDGRTLGAFIMTKNGESFLLSFESGESDILEAAKFVCPENLIEAKKDLLILKSFCSAPALRCEAPPTLQ